MAAEVHHLICAAAARQARRHGLDFALADLINASGHVILGKLVGATPDGRRAGAPLTNGNNPSTGSDRHGLTALINSLARLDTRQIGGQACYLKFGRRLLREDRVPTEALLKTFFATGGSNVMITVISNEELREALVHPEAHRNLVVRVGGFSSRFVELSPDVQEEILARTVS